MAETVNVTQGDAVMHSAHATKVPQSASARAVAVGARRPMPARRPCRAFAIRRRATPAP